jgi:hypothetical protein
MLSSLLQSGTVLSRAARLVRNSEAEKVPSGDREHGLRYDVTRLVDLGVHTAWKRPLSIDIITFSSAAPVGRRPCVHTAVAHVTVDTRSSCLRDQAAAEPPMQLSHGWSRLPSSLGTSKKGGADHRYSALLHSPATHRVFVSITFPSHLNTGASGISKRHFVLKHDFKHTENCLEEIVAYLAPAFVSKG